MPQRRCVIAPDKFRGSATAREVTARAAEAIEALGWQVVGIPMSDGGEGLLDALGGTPRTTHVNGPLGGQVEASWSMLEGDGTAPTAVIEMARASGLELAGGPRHNDPVNATTRGTGELIAAAIAAGARHVIVGCGGSATTDGGRGALEVIESRAALDGAELTVVCDTRTPFLEAARVFAPQKGASPEQVELLSIELEQLARRYVDEFGTDVRPLEHGGAAGGLSGGLAAIGARLVSGFEFVADWLGLDAAIDGADLVVTGEGELDATSFSGKVVGELLARIRPPTRALLIVGTIASGVDRALLKHVEVISLTEHFGIARSLHETGELVGLVAHSYVAALGPD